MPHTRHCCADRQQITVDTVHTVHPSYCCDTADKRLIDRVQRIVNVHCTDTEYCNYYQHIQNRIGTHSARRICRAHSPDHKRACISSLTHHLRWHRYAFLCVQSNWSLSNVWPLACNHRRTHIHSPQVNPCNAPTLDRNCDGH